MKKLFCVAWNLIIFMGLYAQTNVYDTIVHAFLNRTFLLHIPATYNAQQSSPLVIALHGGGSPGWYTLDQASQLSAKSDQAGFLLVYPEGIKAAGIRTWNGGGCCGFAASAQIDDVGFINALIDSLCAEYNIDTSRIYATGLSNGAIMTYRLAAELSNRIAAIAPVSGTLEDANFEMNISRAVPIIHFHSVLDSNIFLKGGLGTKGLLTYAFNPVKYGLQKFALLNNCNAAADSNYFLSGNSFYYKKTWNSCSCGVQQILYVTGDGGHSWPGGNVGAGLEADPPSVILNANDSIWSFFQQHSLTCSMASSVPAGPVISEITVQPNPFSQHAIVQMGTIPKDATLKIFNTNGQLVKQMDHICNGTILLNGEGLNCGTYIIQLSEAGIITGYAKFVISGCL